MNYDPVLQEINELERQCIALEDRVEQLETLLAQLVEAEEMHRAACSGTSLCGCKYRCNCASEKAHAAWLAAKAYLTKGTE